MAGECGASAPLSKVYFGLEEKNPLSKAVVNRRTPHASRDLGTHERLALPGAFEYMVPMFVFLNGQFVSEEQALVSVFDRSFLYGDGLFETMLVRNERPFRWGQHMERLGHGAEFLKLKLPFTASAFQASADQLIAQNRMRDGLLRVTVSRGVGVRGYSPKGANQPTVVMSLHPFADGFAAGQARERNWKLVTASFRLPANERIAQFKTCNKLSQILARAEADAAGADEALLLNTDGFVVEGSSSNLFWIEEGVVCTPPLPSGILAGVTRAVVLELCAKLQLQAREACAKPEQLRLADGVFVSLSAMGVVPAESLDGSRVHSSPVIEKLRTAYDELVREETGG